MKTTRTPNRILAAELSKKQYAGCYGQISHHGAGKISIQIFADADQAARFPYAAVNAQGNLVVADWDINPRCDYQRAE